MEIHWEKPWIFATMSPFIILFRRETPSHKITRKKKKNRSHGLHIEKRSG